MINNKLTKKLISTIQINDSGVQSNPIARLSGKPASLVISAGEEEMKIEIQKLVENKKSEKELKIDMSKVNKVEEGGVVPKTADNILKKKNQLIEAEEEVKQQTNKQLNKQVTESELGIVSEVASLNPGIDSSVNMSQREINQRSKFGRISTSERHPKLGVRGAKSKGLLGMMNATKKEKSKLSGELLEIKEEANGSFVEIKADFGFHGVGGNGNQDKDLLGWNGNVEKKQPRPGSVAGSTTSSFKSTRWGFTEKLEAKNNSTFTVLPAENIKIQYQITNIISSDSFGDVMRIQIKKKSDLVDKDGAVVFGDDDSEGVKSEENKEQDPQKPKGQDVWENDSYILHAIQKSKFSRSERVHILKKASIIVALEQKQNIASFQNMFCSQNQFFFITKEPKNLVMEPPRQLPSSELLSQIQANKDPEQMQKEMFEKQIPLNLFDFIIQRNKAITVKDIYYIMRDILLSVHYMHGHEVYHLGLNPCSLQVLAPLQKYFEEGKMDEKPDNEYEPQFKSNSNIEVNQGEEDNRYIRITGFCLSSGFTKKKFSANSIASLYFMAPERVQGKCSGDMGKADMWAVGALMYCLVFGKTPFEANTNAALVKHINRAKLSELKAFTKKTAPGALKSLFELISKLLDDNPEERLDSAEALNHDFFLKSKDDTQFLQNFNVKSIVQLKKCWLSLQLKDAFKSFINFLSSAHHLSAAFEIIFRQKPARNLKEVANGMSHITEDYQIAKFVVENHFPQSWLDQANNQAGPIDCTTLAKYYLKHYEDLYSDNLKRCYFELIGCFVGAGNAVQYTENEGYKPNSDRPSKSGVEFNEVLHEEILQVIRQNLGHALSIKQLDPQLVNLDFPKLLNFSQGQFYRLQAAAQQEGNDEFCDD